MALPYTPLLCQLTHSSGLCPQTKRLGIWWGTVQEHFEPKRGLSTQAPSFRKERTQNPGDQALIALLLAVESGG